MNALLAAAEAAAASTHPALLNPGVSFSSLVVGVPEVPLPEQPRTVKEAVMYLIQTRGVVVSQDMYGGSPLYFTPQDLLLGQVSVGEGRAVWGMTGLRVASSICLHEGGRGNKQNKHRCRPAPPLTPRAQHNTETGAGHLRDALHPLPGRCGRDATGG